MIKPQQLVAAFCAVLFVFSEAQALNANEQYQLNQMLNGNPSSLRNVAKQIYQAGGATQELLDVLAEQIHSNLGQGGNTYIDALAWSCKALGNSRNKRYAETLQIAANSKAAHRKLNKHCDKSADALGSASGPQYKAGMVNLDAMRNQQQSGAAAPAPRQNTYSAPAPAPVQSGQAITNVAVGMSQSEAFAIAGPPTSSSSHITGKNWIPFNVVGADTRRSVDYYKGQGRIVYSNPSRYSADMRVLEVIINAAESGYP